MGPFLNLLCRIPIFKNLFHIYFESLVDWSRIFNCSGSTTCNGGNRFKENPGAYHGAMPYMLWCGSTVLCPTSLWWPIVSYFHFSGQYYTMRIVTAPLFPVFVNCCQGVWQLQFLNTLYLKFIDARCQWGGSLTLLLRSSVLNIKVNIFILNSYLEGAQNSYSELIIVICLNNNLTV